MSQIKKLSVVIAILIFAGGAYYLSAVSSSAKGDGLKTDAQKASAPQTQKAISVTTVTATRRDYPVRLTANGVVSSINTVEIRPQVSSTVAKVHIREGQFVRQGDLLFTLDSRNDEVGLAKAEAQLDKDLATLADNQRQLARNKELVAKRFLSQSAVDTSQTQVDTQRAVVAADKAAIAAAKVALSYNRIVAPTSGRTGIINVFAGSLVQPVATATPMVTITQMDPVTITFPLPQRSLPFALESMKRNEGEVLASLPDMPQQFRGKLQFVDNVVDAATGTVKVKAIFDNKDLKLWPGAYANLELSVQTLRQVVIIPQDAVIVGPKGKSVYVVNKDNKAEQVAVEVTHSFGKEAVVNGLNAGAQVVLEGKQNLAPGALVKPVASDAGASAADKGKQQAGAA